MKPTFLPGTTYKTRGKYPKTCTVTDIHLTYNLVGDLVKIRYVSTHEFLGQQVVDVDVCEATIKMGLVSAK